MYNEFYIYMVVEHPVYLGKNERKYSDRAQHPLHLHRTLPSVVIVTLDAYSSCATEPSALKGRTAQYNRS